MEDANKIKMMDRTDSMILLLGVTGAGKSTFAQKVSEEVIKIGHKLHSETSETRLHLCKFGATRFFIVDTPGFDDAEMSNTEVLANICKTLTDQFESGLKLKGIIFLHRITDPRFGRSAKQTFDLLTDLCGARAFGNVVLATSMWGDSGKAPSDVLLERENQLSKQYWRKMKEGGARMERFYDDKDCARAIAMSLLMKPGVVLQIQDEISRQERPLGETTVARNMGLLGKVDSETKIDIEKLNQLRANRAARAGEPISDTKHDTTIEEEERKIEDNLKQHERDMGFLNTRFGPQAKRCCKECEEKYGKHLLVGRVFSIIMGIGSLVLTLLGLPTIGVI